MTEETKQKRKLRPGMGKAKGNGYEGTLAKILCASLAPLKFVRTPGSGARLGGKNFEKFGDMFGDEAMKIFVGDVVPINERKVGFKFLHSIEAKFYATPDNFTSLASGSANIYKWFEESVLDAKKIDKNPVLIFKWNRTPNFVAIDKNNPLCPQSTINPKFCIDVATPQGNRYLQIYVLEDLLKDIDFWMVKE